MNKKIKIVGLFIILALLLGFVFEANLFADWNRGEIPEHYYKPEKRKFTIDHSKVNRNFSQDLQRNLDKPDLVIVEIFPREHLSPGLVTIPFVVIFNNIGHRAIENVWRARGELTGNGISKISIAAIDWRMVEQAPNDRRMFHLEFNLAEPIAPGDYTISVNLDIDDNVDEINNNNNQQSQEIEIR
ncbi:MAG: hypothetical protein AB1755_06680 [Candidatus Omnitrophota bacterium]